MISEIKVNFDFNRLEERIDSILKQFMNKSASKDIVKASKKKIKSGKVKPSLKPSTIAIRKKRGTGGNTPLFETGQLHDSLKSTKDGIEVIDYAKNHLSGYTTSSDSMIPNKKVPERNFIEIPSINNRKLIDEMKQAMHLQRPLVLKL